MCSRRCTVARRRARSAPCAERRPQVLKALDDWMQRQESLVVKRHSSERIVWEARPRLRRHGPARGEWARRCARARERRRRRRRSPLDESSRVLVRLDAHLGGYRALMAPGRTSRLGGRRRGRGRRARGAELPGARRRRAGRRARRPAAVAAGRASQHARTVERAQLALEQVLDRLERGEAGAADVAQHAGGGGAGQQSARSDASPRRVEFPPSALPSPSHALSAIPPPANGRRIARSASQAESAVAQDARGSRSA